MPDWVGGVVLVLILVGLCIGLSSVEVVRVGNPVYTGGYIPGVIQASK